MRTVPVAQMNPNTESASREELAPVPARPHSPPARDRDGTPPMRPGGPETSHRGADSSAPERRA